MFRACAKGERPLPSADDQRLLAPVAKRQIVMRMLRNLSNMYLKSLNLLLAADPTDRAEIETLQSLRGCLARLN